MRIGLLSDAHGNSIGLAACLKRLGELGVEHVYFLGDAVGYLPGERDVLALLRDNNVECQKGNHEAMLLGELSSVGGKERILGIERARARLSESDLQYLAGWPDHRILEVNGKKLLLVHGSPLNYLQGYVYPDNDLQLFEGLPFDSVFMGHTHRPFTARRSDGMQIVNVGSCGIPRDHGELLAFAVYDAEQNECEVLRLRFDANEVKNLFAQEEVATEVYNVLERRTEGPPFGRILDGGLYTWNR